MKAGDTIKVCRAGSEDWHKGTVLRHKEASQGGGLCDWCEEPIAAAHVAIPHHGTPGKLWSYFHHECFVRSYAGSVAHQERRCSCFGGAGEDDPTLTTHQAAQAAFELFCQTHGIDQPKFLQTNFPLRDDERWL